MNTFNPSKGKCEIRVNFTNMMNMDVTSLFNSQIWPIGWNHGTLTRL